MRDMCAYAFSKRQYASKCTEMQQWMVHHPGLRSDEALEQQSQIQRARLL